MKESKTLIRARRKDDWRIARRETENEREV